jgi:hypothetical protein
MANDLMTRNRHLVLNSAIESMWFSQAIHLNCTFNSGVFFYRRENTELVPLRAAAGETNKGSAFSLRNFPRSFSLR